MKTKKKALAVVRFLFRFATVFGALWLGNFLSVYYTGRFEPQIRALVSLIMTCVLLYSLSRLLVLFEHPDERYEGNKTASEKASFLLHRKKTLVAFALFLLLPLPYPALNTFFGAFSPFIRYLLARSILPFFLLAYLLGSMTGFKFHEKNKEKKINRAPFFFLLHTAKYVILYAIGACALCALSYTIFSIPGILLLFITSSIGITIAVLFGTLWAVRILRAVSKRRTFLASLKKACDERGIPMPEIEMPIRSLFRKIEKGSVFTVTVGKRKYACKLIYTMRPNSLYRFYENGNVGCVHLAFLRFFVGARGFGAMLYRQRIELWEKQMYVGFDADDDATKIWIFNPCSKLVEGDHNGSNFTLDNGMIIGEYHFFTASGFCNALSRDCLHRRANE